MRRALALAVAVSAFAGTADAAAPVRGGAFCWDFDIVGTDGPERLEGTAGPEHAAAYAGRDELLMFGGDDCAATGAGHDVVHLGPGNDEADSGSGDDSVFGGPGNDSLLPGIGADRVEGGEGDDLLRDEQGDTAPDVLDAGPGHDFVRAIDGAADTVRCGPGYDVTVIDAADITRDCERVVIARRPGLWARALRTGIRPSHALEWSRLDLPPTTRVAVRAETLPAAGKRCGVDGWRVRGGSKPRLVWSARRRACAGEYAFTITHVAGATGRRVACEQLAGAPPEGCAPTERLGVVHVTVL